MKILSGLLIVTICCLSLSMPVMAQTSQTKQEQQTQKVKEKIKKLGLGERVRVKVKLYNDTTYEGYVREANEDAFVIVDKLGNPNTAKYSEVKSVGGRNLSTGAKIGIGVGIGAGAVLIVILALIASLDD